jgi:hypothetical protein
VFLTSPRIGALRNRRRFRSWLHPSRATLERRWMNVRDVYVQVF